MKLKTSHLLIILVVLTGIVFLAKYFQSKKEKGSLITDFFEINYDQVSKFAITPQFKSDQKFDVVKENGRWFITNTGGYRYEASAQFMDRALKELRKLKPTRLAATLPEKFPAYGVDSVGTLLEIFDDQGSYSIILGSMTFQNQSMVNTYCRLPDDNNTYAVEAYMEGTFKSDINGWRNRDIIPFETPSWNSLSVQSTGQNLSFQLKKEGNHWYANGRESDSALTADLLTFLDRIRSLGFADDAQATSLGQPALTIDVAQNDSLQGVQVNLFRTPNIWLLNSSLNEGNYFTADTNRINPLLISIEALAKQK